MIISTAKPRPISLTKAVASLLVENLKAECSAARSQLALEPLPARRQLW
jgi:hypothetical protein